MQLNGALQRGGPDFSLFLLHLLEAPVLFTLVAVYVCRKNKWIGNSGIYKIKTPKDGIVKKKKKFSLRRHNGFRKSLLCIKKCCTSSGDNFLFICFKKF